MSNIYTIGFQDFAIDDFINLLKRKGITFLIDIRSKPYSDRYPAYNKDNLKTTLTQETIHQRMIEKYFPHQVGVAVDCNYQLLLEKVYKEQNKVIGFRR